MTNNLQFTVIPTAIGGRSDLFNAAMEEADDRITETLNILVDDSNAAAITQEDLRRYSGFIISPDTTPPDAEIQLTAPIGNWGIIDIYNATAQDVALIAEEV